MPDIVHLCGVGFIVAAVCSSIPFDGSFRGITEDAQAAFMGAHFFATTLFLILHTNNYILNGTIQFITAICLLIDNSIVYYVVSILLGITFVGYDKYSLIP
jgi:hypothetical protein